MTNTFQLCVLPSPLLTCHTRHEPQSPSQPLDTLLTLHISHTSHVPQEKEKLVLASARQHHVLKAPHPSPLAAASGQAFVGCKHFSKANLLLEAQGLAPIDWQIE